MNKYIVPVCNVQESKIYNKIIIANSNTSCQEKIMEMFSEYSDKDDWREFLQDLDEQDILIGRITDIEEL